MCSSLARGRRGRSSGRLTLAPVAAEAARHSRPSPRPPPPSPPVPRSLPSPPSRPLRPQRPEGVAPSRRCARPVARRRRAPSHLLPGSDTRPPDQSASYAPRAPSYWPSTRAPEPSQRPPHPPRAPLRSPRCGVFAPPPPCRAGRCGCEYIYSTERCAVLISDTIYAGPTTRGLVGKSEPGAARTPGLSDAGYVHVGSCMCARAVMGYRRWEARVYRKGVELWEGGNLSSATPSLKIQCERSA